MQNAEQNKIAARLSQLRRLEAGWLAGKGKLLPSAEIDWFEAVFCKNYPDEFPHPSLYPTAAGGLQLEWSIGHHEISLEVDLKNHTAEWHSLDTRTDHDQWRRFDLNAPAAWSWLIQHLVEKLPVEAP